MTAEASVADMVAPVAGTDTDAAPAAAPSAASAKRRTRRRFSLPPLEHDARIERSIETFLGGGEATSAGEGNEEADGDGPRAGATDATTVALVAVVQAGSGSVHGRDEGWTDAVAIVERTLRAAARGSDDVAATDPGHFRVALRGTGELAARAYLRRIRATVEPLLHASSPSLDLVSSTATVLDEPLEAAIELAERRLDAAIRTAVTNADGSTVSDPRAAAD